MVSKISFFSNILENKREKETKLLREDGINITKAELFSSHFDYSSLRGYLFHWVFMKNRFKEHSSSLSLERNIVKDLFTLKEFKSQEIDELHSRIPNPLMV